ncbi:MAG TPA: type VI secretion system protein TssR domain-containing protein, partial [Cytophagales bacterium]|nr:type VI secretion system protein TssR domain-containing protein [Cytophagales bacterium]
MAKTQYNTLKSIAFIFLCFCMVVNAYAQAPKLSAGKVRKVEKKPYAYDSPTNPLSSNLLPLEKPWIVYSDRNDNLLYSDSKLSNAISKVQFLDSFYVSNISGDAFEVIKYDPTNVKYPNTIISPDKVQPLGWIDRNRLVLSDNSFLDASTKRSVKYVTMLKGAKLFEQVKKYADGNRIKVYSDPELTSAIEGSEVLFDQIVFVYRQYKDRVLLGKTNSFSPKDANKRVIGWVHSSFVQSWGARLSIEPDNDTPKLIAQTVLYATKDQAHKFKINEGQGFPMLRKGCDVNEHLWGKSPVFDIEYHSDIYGKYKVIKSGIVLNPFDRSQSYIYNVNGTKLPYNRLCDMIEKSKNVNIVFAVNMDNDTKEYLYV